MKQRILTSLQTMFRSKRGIWLVLWALGTLSASAASINQFEGRYTGGWTNSTFGTFGPVMADVLIDGTNATISFDFGGLVFGIEDPPLAFASATVQGDRLIIQAVRVGLFGDIRGVLDTTSSTAVLTLTNLPVPVVSHVLAEGTFELGRLQLNYAVYRPGALSDINPALGVVRLAKANTIVFTDVRRKGDSVVLEWSGGRVPYTLQGTDNLLSGTWERIDGAISNLTKTVSISSGKRFFRVVNE